MKKFLATIGIIHMCLLPVVSAYGQELQQTTMNTPSEIILPISDKEQTGIANQAAAAKNICDALGMSPILLPKAQQCTDPYIGRLKVEGIWEGRSLDPNQLMSQEAWEHVMGQVENYLQGTGKEMPYAKKISKSQVAFDEVPVGKLTKSKSIVSYNKYHYSLYEVAGTSFVRLKDLGQMGLIQEHEEGFTKLSLPSQIQSQAGDSKVIEGTAKSNKDVVAIGNLQTYSIKCGEETLIPLRALCSLFTLEFNGTMINLRETDENMNTYVTMDHQKLRNISDRSIDLTMTSLYWDGKNIQKVIRELEQLPSGGTVDLPKHYFALQNSEMCYITTLVDQVNYIEDDGNQICNTYVRDDSYGQGNRAYFEAYEKGKHPVVVPKPATNLFPNTIIMGTMKYSSGALKKGQKVEVWAAEKGIDYTVIYEGQKVKIPWESISIPSNPQVEKEQATKKQLEDYINNKGVISKTDYFVWTDLHRQRTYVFKNEKGSWVLYKRLLCSTGNNKTPTPRGEYTLTSYVPAFGMNKGYMCKNAVGIFGDYLYHSIMFDKTGSYQLSGAARLGHQASSGCIRLSYEDSVWFYKNMPLGTKVWIN